MSNNDYIRDDGKIARHRIVSDIIDRKLKKDDIEKLVILTDPLIIDSFIGKGLTGFAIRKPQNEWNKVYLDKLVWASVAECFNRDYLLYLDEVAGYIANEALEKNRKKRLIAIVTIVIILIIIIGVINV